MYFLSLFPRGGTRTFLFRKEHMYEKVTGKTMVGLTSRVKTIFL